LPDEPVWFSADEPEVGTFRQGTELSQWALARYLVGRAIARSVGDTLLLIGIGIVALAVVIGWLTTSVGWGVFIGVVGLGVLAVRGVLLWLLRALTAFRSYRPLEHRMRALVGDTRSDVLRELRRIGLPGRTWTLPFLALRLLRRNRRKETLARLREFDLAWAVPPARLDELHLLLRTAVGRGAAPA
jgi:hypothetical protein